MTNMSYCRFENTSRDLTDCHNALGEMIEESGERELSREEKRAAQQLVATCWEILSNLADNAGVPLDEVDTPEKAMGLLRPLFNPDDAS